MAPSRRRGSSKASSAAAAAAAKRNWKVGDLVLAKVKGFPAWPATVSEPEKWGYSTDWKKVLVFFFGTKQIAFCNHADVEAFTEDKKKSLLSKRHGKGVDFVRAVQEIVDCYEKSKEQERDGEENLAFEGTISTAEHLGNSMGKTENRITPRSPVAIHNSNLEDLCVSANNSELHLIDVHSVMGYGNLHNTDTISEEQVEKAPAIGQLRVTSVVASDSLRKRLSDAPLQSFALQKRTVVRRSRSKVNVEPSNCQSQIMPPNDSTYMADVLPNGTRNECAKRSRRIRKSPGTSIWHQMDSPGYSTAFASTVSSEDNNSEIGTTNSDKPSFDDVNTLGSGSRSEHPEIVAQCLDRDIQVSDVSRPPAEILVFKKKRKPNRKLIAHSEAALAVSPNRCSDMDIHVEKTIPHSPNASENLPDRFSRGDGDEHLPLVKRARVRMGKPLPEEKQLNTLVDAGKESCKDVTMNSSEPPLTSFRCNKDFRDVNGSTATNGYCHIEKEPFWNMNRYQLRGSVDGEAALPPSKRLHRALEAMSANAAAEEGQTFIDAQGTTKDGCSNSSDKGSSYVSVDNEVRSASELQNANSFGDNDANINGEAESQPDFTSPALEVVAKASSDPKFGGSLLDCSTNTSISDDQEMKKLSTNLREVKHDDELSLTSHSGKTKVCIKSPHSSSSLNQKLGAPGCRPEPMDLSSTLIKRENFEVSGSSHESSNETSKLEQAYHQEDKSALEQGTSRHNHQGHPSVAIGDGLRSPGGDGVHLSVENADPFKNMQSLMTPLNKNVQAMCEDVKEVKHKLAEEDIDANSMKVLIAAAQAKRQLSLSTSLSDNLPDDKVVHDSVSSPSSVRRVGSYEPVSPPSSRAPHMHTASLDVHPHYKKYTHLLEKEEVGNMVSLGSHNRKSSCKGTNIETSAVRKSFESMLGTLSRTKESIGRATRLAIDCAKYGIAGEVLEILVRTLENESSLHKRVDLFFLVDSITQCSRGQKGNIGDIFPSAVQGMLPRLLSAAAPPGNAARENRRQCLKVLKLWLERKTLPESIIRHHMRELESTNASFTTLHSRRPLRMERALNDPIREMEGMHVDEYGSNACFQLPGFCMPSMLEDEAESDAEEGSFEAVTPEQDPEITVEQEPTPTSTFEKHCHILEDVDGELEMEDVSPSYENQNSSANVVSAVDNIESSLHRFEQHPPLPFAPPLPEDCPPSPPPLPASPPPVVPPPPLPPQSVICHPFTDSAELNFHPNSHGMQNLTQHHISQQPDTPTANLNSAIVDTVQYYAPEYRDMRKQPLRSTSFSSSSSCSNTPAPYPSGHTRNNMQQIDGGSLYNKSHQLQPPPPMLSNQFSYVHADQRRQSWMEASPSSFTRRFRFGRDMHRDDIYESRERMKLTQHDIGERRRVAAPVPSVRAQLDNPEAVYGPISHYGPPKEPAQPLNRGWSFPPRTLNYHNSTPFRPPEALSFWRPR